MCVVPLHVSEALPEYVISARAFDAAMQRRWAAGDSFRMYFATGEDAEGNATGTFYKGTVRQVSTVTQG